MANVNLQDLYGSEEPGYFQAGSATEAAARGLSSGATLGIGPYVGALVHSGTKEPTSLSEAWQNLKGFPQRYGQSLTEEKAAQTSAAATNPIAYGAANVLGGIPSALATGGESLLGAGTVKGVLGSTIGRNVAAGTIQGAADSGTVTGAAEGGALSGVGAGVFGAAGKVGTLLKDKLGRNVLADALVNPKVQTDLMGTMTPKDQIKYFGFPGQPGRIGDIATQLRNPNISSTSIQETLSQGNQSFLNRAAWHAAESQPGVFQGMVDKATSMAKSPLEMGIGSSLGILTGLGNVSPTAAILGAAVPIVAGGVAGASWNAAKNASVSSFLRPNDALQTGQQFLGSAGGYAGRIGDRLANLVTGNANPPQPEQSAPVDLQSLYGQ
jgi:hypothetical protein